MHVLEMAAGNGLFSQLAAVLHSHSSQVAFRKEAKALVVAVAFCNAILEPTLTAIYYLTLGTITHLMRDTYAVKCFVPKHSRLQGSSSESRKQNGSHLV